VEEVNGHGTMGYRNQMVLLFAFVFLCSCAGREKQTPPNLATVQAYLSSGVIRRLEIYYLPEDILTRASLSPERLQQGATQRVIINYPSQKFLNTVADALRAETFTANTDKSEGDIRLGILMYSESDKPVISIFFDQFGRKCTFAGVSYTASGPLRSLFREYMTQLPR
jgi:hypothetical protein